MTHDAFTPAALVRYDAVDQDHDVDNALGAPCEDCGRMTRTGTWRRDSSVPILCGGCKMRRRASDGGAR